MYKIDHRDKIVELQAVPQSSPGAPCPMLIANEHQLWLAFYVREDDSHWDGKTCRLVDENSDETCAVVHFKGLKSHILGQPDEMRTHLHPLGRRGLTAYMSVEVIHSSWIRKLAAFHAKIPRHWPHAYDKARHFIFTFHDSSFECIADSFEVTIIRSSVHAALAGILSPK